MNPQPYPFQDFVRAKHSLLGAVLEHLEPFALLTGETGTGKTALLRDVRGQLDRARHRVWYFSEARKLGAAGLVKVVQNHNATRCHPLGHRGKIKIGEGVGVVAVNKGKINGCGQSVELNEQIHRVDG